MAAKLINNNNIRKKKNKKKHNYNKNYYCSNSRTHYNISGDMMLK